MPFGATFGPQITLGRLIELLEQRPQDETVRFDFEHMHPDDLTSYRGFYEDLAVSFTDEGEPPTVEWMLAKLRGAVGESFSGWKGGRYRMQEGTPLWVARPGNAGSTVITGIGDCSFQTIITTAYVDV